MSKIQEKWTRTTAFKGFTTGKYDEEIKFNVFLKHSQSTRLKKNVPINFTRDSPFKMIIAFIYLFAKHITIKKDR